MSNAKAKNQNRFIKFNAFYQGDSGGAIVRVEEEEPKYQLAFVLSHGVPSILLVKEFYWLCQAIILFWVEETKVILIVLWSSAYLELVNSISNNSNLSYISYIFAG